MKAYVTKVQIGNLEIDGLMDEQGNYFVAIPQIADLVNASRNNLSRDLKRILGKDLPKLKTEFNRNTTSCVPLQDLESVLLELSLKGNTEAKKFLTGYLTKKKESKVKSQQLYLMMTDDKLYVKIGVSVDPERRLKGVQTGCPTLVSLVRTIKTRNARKLENKLHKMLADYNTSGEWFDSSVLSLVNWELTR
jgi:hypothetical protein